MDTKTLGAMFGAYLLAMLRPHVDGFLGAGVNWLQNRALRIPSKVSAGADKALHVPAGTIEGANAAVAGTVAGAVGSAVAAKVEELEAKVTP